MMDFDFELLLTVLVGLFGVGYALDVWLWKPARVKALALATVSAGGVNHCLQNTAVHFFLCWPLC